jgi:putative two-component system response regulator
MSAEIDPELIRLIFLTSPLHDIGKVGIPDAVLRKPGRLNAAEFEIMKTHTTLGAETLDAALVRFPEARFLHVARNIAAAHHERWDGSGYPLGLAGEQIPLCARVVALADVYDALTTRRCYKEAYSHLVARSIIETDSGKHFDPRVVAAFLAAEEEFLAIQRRFSDRHEAPSFPPSGWSSSAGIQTHAVVTAG